MLRIPGFAQWIVAVAVVVVAVVVAIASTVTAHGPGKGMLRHQYFMTHGIPEPYRGVQNPAQSTTATVKAGLELFQDNCAICHGATGIGDGEGAEDLDPKPANLMDMMAMPMATDGYLFWSAMDGGEALGTDMLAFKDVLSEMEIWQIITALRAGLSAEGDPTARPAMRGPMMGPGGMGSGPMGRMKECTPGSNCGPGQR